MKFRKKPVVVEAVQYQQLTHFGKLKNMGLCWEHTHNQISMHVPHIHTLEGIMFVSDGDWIIRGVAGEFYPCKPEIFEKTYEQVE